MMKFKPFFLTLITVLSFLISCGISSQEQEAKKRLAGAASARKDSLAFKIAVTPTLDCLPIYVACDSGIFSQLGVDVSLKPQGSHMDCDELFKAQKVEGMVSDLMRTERLRHQGLPLRYVSATNAYWQFIGNRRGRIRELKQMGDKMVAMSRYSATDYLATLGIDSVRPDLPVFRIQVNDVNVRLMMLLNNEMDAVLLPEPQATTARQARNPLFMDSRGRDIRLGVIAVRSYVDHDPSRKSQLDMFLKGYNMACDSINEKGLKYYADIIIKHCQTDAETVKSLPAITFPHATPPREKDIALTKNVQWRTY